jgi:serine O-acetyltransferase
VGRRPGEDHEQGYAAGVRELRRRHPRFRAAVAADARLTAVYRGERHDFTSRMDLAFQVARLAIQSDAFLAQVLYRLKARLQALGVPLVPRVAHHLAMTVGQLSIGDPVVVHPGVYVLHGQVVIDGLAEIRSGAMLSPFVTVGLRAGDLRGPIIGHDVMLGTGAKVIGPVTVGDGATVGANAVVVGDVEPGATVVGAPARPVSGRR